MGLLDSEFIQIGLRTMANMSQANKEWEVRIYDEWDKTKKMPRKKKKHIRKNLLVQYSIQQFGKKLIEDPMHGFSF